MVRLSISAALTLIILSGCGQDAASSDGESKQTSKQAAGQPATPTEFAGALFEALAKNDEAAFKRHYQQDMAQLVPFMRKLIAADAKAKKREEPPLTDAQITEGLKGKQLSGTVDALPALRAEGEKLGIDWSQVSNVKPEQWRPTDIVDGISLADCRVIFESKGKKFQLSVGDVTKVGDKWFSHQLRLSKSQ